MKYKFENVICTNVVDGDTIDVEIDFGFKLKQVVRLRFNRINTPEIRGKERKQGLIAVEYVMNKIFERQIKVETFKKGKYGRYLAEIYYHRQFKNGGFSVNYRNLNDDLVKEGLAEYKEY